MKLSGSSLSGVATAKFANIFGGAVLQNNYKYELHRVDDNPVQAAAWSANDGAELGRIRQGQHSELPAAVSSTSGTLGQNGSLTIQNRTAFLIHVYLRGPASFSLAVGPGKERSVSLPNGLYEEAADAIGAPVAAFYGTHTQSGGARYTVAFALQ